MTKSDAENATLKAAHDATRPAPEAPAASVLTPVSIKDHIKLPDGVTLTDESAAEFEALLNDHTLSRPQLAQKLIDMQIKAINDLSERGKTRVAEMHDGWVKTIQSDPTIGGDKLPSVLDGISTLLDNTPNNDAVRAAFDLTGAGNHPAIVSFLHWVASKLNEGGPAPAPTPTDQLTDAANRMFPSMKT